MLGLHCAVWYYIFTWLYFVSGSVVFENEAERLKTPEVRKPTTRYIESRRQKIRSLVEKYDALKAKIMKRRAEWHEL